MNDFTLSSDKFDDNDVLMVDVGGGAGYQCTVLRESHPDLRGRIVLQDLAATIAMTNQSKMQQLRIETQDHDFTKAQPVKQAKIYYLRNIMHDWDRDTCVTILKHLRDAMGSESIIIVDDMVVSETESNWKQVNYDITMMSALAGMERTEAQWRDLFLAADLRLRNVIEYDSETGDSIIIAAPIMQINGEN